LADFVLLALALTTRRPPGSNSPALITVPKETGQTTKTVLPQNFINMFARLPGRPKS
jgi:hypothetical protein